MYAGYVIRFIGSRTTHPNQSLYVNPHALFIIGEGMNRFVRSMSKYGLFFVMPGNGIDAHTSARRLMRVPQIKEVLITEGSCGFVVRADSDNEDQVKLERTISRIVGGSSKAAVCHCQYKK